jgi:hypothetical protein
LLSWVRVSLRRSSVHATIDRLERLYTRRSTLGVVSASPIPDLVRAVDLADALLPGRASCLERSILIRAMLRHRAVDAEICIGVKTRNGFTAHAWVESGGEVVGESAETVARFERLNGPIDERFVAVLE